MTRDNALYGAFLVFLCGASAHADNEDVIAQCARIATVGDRILCLENALRQSAHEAVETPVAVATPTKEPTVVEEATANEKPIAEAPPPIVEDAPQADEDFGLKEKRPPIREASAVQVTVTSVRKNLTNRFIFETDSGQRWLQTDQRTVRYGDAPFDAEIRPASMGSYFLKPVAGGASVRVRREK